MDSKKSRIIPICTMLVVLILLMAFILLFPFHSPTALQISFAGVTNDPIAGTMGFFCATNESASAIHFFACPLQTKTHGAWSQLLCSGRPLDLPSHSSIGFSVVYDTNSAPWRTPVFWWYDDNGYVESFVYWRSVAEANAVYNWQAVVQGRKPSYIGNAHGFGYSYISYSATVTNQ